MKAVVCTRYGPPEVLQLKEIAKPLVRDHDVLVKVMAATVTMGDCELRGMRFPSLMGILVRLGFGFLGPRRKVLGQELSGVVEAVGKGVQRFKPGDKVFAVTGFSLGAYAEYARLPGDGVIAPLPSNMSFEEGAAVPMGGLNALHHIREAYVKDGQELLINGAGGSIGTMAVQIAKSLGAKVTAVDNHGKLDMLRSLGADDVIDYEEEDFTLNKERYDVILDVVGKAPMPRCMDALVPEGAYVLGNPTFTGSRKAKIAARRCGKRFVGGTARYRTEDLLFLKELIEARKVRTAIDRSYPIERIVEAHRYVENGHKNGNVIIIVAGSGNRDRSGP